MSPCNVGGASARAVPAALCGAGLRLPARLSGARPLAAAPRMGCSAPKIAANRYDCVYVWGWALLLDADGWDTVRWANLLPAPLARHGATREPRGHGLVSRMRSMRNACIFKLYSVRALPSSRIHCLAHLIRVVAPRATSGGSGGGVGGGNSGGNGGRRWQDGDGEEDKPKKRVLWQGWADRVAADPQFVYKVVIEQVRFWCWFCGRGTACAMATSQGCSEGRCIRQRVSAPPHCRSSVWAPPSWATWPPAPTGASTSSTLCLPPWWWDPSSTFRSCTCWRPPDRPVRRPAAACWLASSASRS